MSSALRIGQSRALHLMELEDLTNLSNVTTVTKVGTIPEIVEAQDKIDWSTAVTPRVLETKLVRHSPTCRTKLVGLEGSSTPKLPNKKCIYLPQSKVKNKYCLLDSGCQLSILPSSVVDDLELLPSKRRMKTANEAVIPVLGEVEVDLHFGSLILPTRFLVSNHVTEVMLGFEFSEAQSGSVGLQQPIHQNAWP